MLKKPGVILLVASISALLSSCHIEQKDVETIPSVTNTLRIYKAGERIEYNVTATNLNTGMINRGILTVKWEATSDLIDPINTTITIPVLKETTTLTYDDDNTADPAIVIRYISQINTEPPSTNQGRIILHAIDDGSGTPTNPNYWPYDTTNASTPNSNADVISPVIFDSPIVVGTPENSSLNFSIMEGCGSGTCGTEIYNFIDNISVDNKTSEITTELGKLTKLFKISFSGRNIPKGGLTLSVLGDIRHACGDSTKDLTHFGNMLVMPEVGIVQMENTCQVDTDPINNVHYSITINNNTNIPPP